MFGFKDAGSKFKNTVLYAALGIVVGIVLGFVFGLIISFLSGLVSSGVEGAPPREIATFLGMGFGAVISGIFGGVVGYKD